MFKAQKNCSFYALSLIARFRYTIITLHARFYIAKIPLRFVSVNVLQIINLIGL